MIKSGLGRSKRQLLKALAAAKLLAVVVLLRVSGLGLRVSAFGVSGLGFRGLGFRGSGFRGSGFRI